MNLKGKNAIVTGGSKGIGKSIVLELATLGCNVVFTYNSSETAAQEVVNEAGKFGTKVFMMKADASDFNAANETINFALEKLGSIDFMINNAGITKDTLLLRMTPEDFNNVVDTNLKSVFNYSKAVLKTMMSQRSGKIINISSIVGIIGNPGQANYAASKAGIIGFSKSMAKEVASRNITVNTIAPGFIQTDMTSKLNEKQKEALTSMIPLGREGNPSDVAGLVAFLCSNKADYITGQVISVDGGMNI